MDTHNNSQLLQQHQQAIEHSPFDFDNQHSNPKVIVDQLSPESGSGFIDLYDLDRLIVSRADLVFCQPQQMTQPNNLSYLGFSIVLSGEIQLQYANIDAPITAQAGQVWWRQGYLGQVEVRIPAQQKLQVLSVDFHHDLLNKLLGDHTLDSQLKNLLQTPSECCLKPLDVFQRVLLKAYQLLHLPSAQSELELIHLEAASLGLAAAILSSDSEKNKPTHQDNIEMAGVILRNECHKKITTRQLAKRVGMNEFSLKQQFKQHYQMTIGAFIREKRMLLALDLLAAGCPLHHIATQTGYSNKNYFVQVFTQYFGHPPSDL